MIWEAFLMTDARVSWTIGLAAGVAAGVVAAGAALIAAGLVGRSFPEVTPVTIVVAAVLPNLVGGLFYGLLARRTRHARLLYAATAVVIGGVYTIVVGAHHPAHPGFMTLIVPLHTTVTVASVVVIPTAARWLVAWRAHPSASVRVAAIKRG